MNFYKSLSKGTEKLEVINGWDFPSHPTNKNKEDSYVSSYIASGIQFYIEIKHNIRFNLYGSMYGICDLLHHSW